MHRILAAALVVVGIAPAMSAVAGTKTEILYDNFDKPGGYSMADYASKWSNRFGLGEMALPGGDTRNFSGGKFNISAAPFRTASDSKTLDHGKYFAISTQTFAVPARGSVTFSAVIEASTPGTQANRVIEGTFVRSGQPYKATALQGQQAAAVMNMIDFTTGQLFDWFVAGNTAFTLIERLPSSRTGSPLPAGRDQIYTQIIREIPIVPGPHTVAITYTRRTNGSGVEYFIDGIRISTVKNVGVPLELQG